MSTRKRNIKDHFSPSANKMKRTDINQNPNKKSTAEATNPDRKGQHHCATGEEASSSKGPKILVDLPQLENIEELCPVTWKEFRKYTNVTELIIEDTKGAHPNTYEERIRDEKYLNDMIQKFYITFYTKPKYRQSRPITYLKLLKECPLDVKKCIYSIPEAFQKKKKHKHKKKDKRDATNESKTTKTDNKSNVNHSEDLINPKPGTSKSAKSTQTSPTKDFIEEKSIAYPVNLKKFKKYVNFDEDFDNYLLKLCKGEEKKFEELRLKKSLRSEYAETFYKKFYAMPCVRHKLKFKFKSCPQSIKDKILLRASYDTKSSPTCEKSNANASNNSETDNFMHGDNNNEENQFENIIQLPDVDNEAKKRFPITFGVFLEHTNVLDIIDEEICQSQQSDIHYMLKLANKFFIAFYTKPELRNSKPLKALKCTLQNKLFEIPSKYQANELPENDEGTEACSKTSKETDTNIAVTMHLANIAQKQADDPNRVDNLPRTSCDNLMKLFKKYLNCDEIIDEIFKEAAKNNSEIFKKLQNDKALRSRALRNYYEAFYKKPEIRQRYKFRMKPCSSSIRKLILQIPGKDCFSVGNSSQQLKRSAAEVVNNPEEKPQSKKQRILETEVNVDSPLTNVNPSVTHIKEIQSESQNILTNLKCPDVDMQNSNAKTLHFSDYVANLSEDLFKKYLTQKSLDCFTEQMQSLLLQRIKDKALKTKSLTVKPSAKIHIQSVKVIKPPDTNFKISKKRLTLAYAAYLSVGLKQRILFAVLNMSFDEFQKYTRIHSGAEFNENEHTLQLYNSAIAVEKLWHPRLYMSLLDLQEYLTTKGIRISDIDFKHISPIILNHEEISSITNFDDIVRLDYFKETAKRLTDEESLLNERRIHFYNKCKSHNQWIWKTPVLESNWKTILQNNAAEYMPKLIVSPRRSVENDNCIKEATAEEKSYATDDNIDENNANRDNVFQSEATEQIKNFQNLETATQAPAQGIETLSIAAEKSTQNLLAMTCGLAEKQENLDLAVTSRKLTDVPNQVTAKNVSGDIFLPSSNESIGQHIAVVRVSQDVLLSSASSEIGHSQSAIDLYYSHLVKTPSKLASTPANKVEYQPRSSSSKQTQFSATSTKPKTTIPLSPNIFTSSGSTNSQPHSQNLAQQKTIAETSTHDNDNGELFINMPNTQTQIQSLPSDEHLNFDPLSDVVEQQMKELFAGEGETIAVLYENVLSKQTTQDVFNRLVNDVIEGTANDVNTYVLLKNNEREPALLPVLEDINNAALNNNSSANTNNKTVEDQITGNLTETSTVSLHLHMSTELRADETNENTAQKSRNLEDVVNIVSTISLPSETAVSTLVVSNVNSVQPIETICTSAAEDLQHLPVVDSQSTGNNQTEAVSNIINLPSETSPNVRLMEAKETNSSKAVENSEQLSVDNTHTSDANIKKKAGLPNSLKFSLNDSEIQIIETNEPSPIIISDDDDDGNIENKTETQPKIAVDGIKQEIKFLDKLQFTMDDSDSTPQICPLEPSPSIVLDDDDDDDCSTALIEQLMNPVDETTAKSVGISRISSAISDETDTFCEAQKIPSSIEENETVLGNQQQQQITESDDIESVQTVENINEVPADSDNIESILATNNDYYSQQNVQIFADRNNSLQSSEELVYEFTIPSTGIDFHYAEHIGIAGTIELPEQECVNVDNGVQQVNIDATAHADPQVSTVDNCDTAKEYSSNIPSIALPNINVFSSNITQRKKPTSTKRKQTKNTDIVPQILHAFRPLKICPVTKAHENQRQNQTSDVNDEQEDTATPPSQVITTESKSVNSSSDATKSFSASQALATDCTLFNNTELLRDLQQLPNKAPEEISSVNVQATSSTCSLASTVSAISTVTTASEQGAKNA